MVIVKEVPQWNPVYYSEGVRLAIVGTRRKERLMENLGALQVQLSAADVERISSVVPRGAAAGTRYPAGGMRAVYL